MRILSLLLTTLISLGCLRSSNQPLVGHFEGYFEYKNKKLNAAIDFNYQNGKQVAFLSVPDNLQVDKAFTDVAFNGKNIALKMEDNATPLTIVATLHQYTIDGKLDGPIPAIIHFDRIENYKPPRKNYAIKSVVLSNGGIKLSANLYLPATAHLSAAVIMVAGSGNHRKEEYNGSAALFASRGIAVLTFDKRNVTNPSGLKLRYINSDITTMSALVSDVETALYFLKSQKEVDQTKIGLMGFSLGAVEVPVVAAKHPDIAFVVAVSGNATTDREFIINQALNKYRENNFDARTINKAAALYGALFTYAQNRLNSEGLQKKLDDAYAEKWGQLCFPKEVPNDDELKYLLSWNNFEFDPADYWKKIKVPCLVVYGENDKLIPVKHSIEILHRVFDAKAGLLTIKLYHHADHTIRIVSEKDFEFPHYVKGYVDDLLNWLLKETA